MLINATPSLEQIRWYVTAAMNVFETLEPDYARQRSRDYLSSLLEYLSAFDHAKDLFVSRVAPIEFGLRVEFPLRDHSIEHPLSFDLKPAHSHLKASDSFAPSTIKQDMGMQFQKGAVPPELNGDASFNSVTDHGVSDCR
jgi:hypothetical protein